MKLFVLMHKDGNPMPKLEFEEKTHEYKVDGVVYPATTKILESVGLSDISKVNPAILERACLFGKAVHDAVSFKCKGTLDEDNLDDEIKPYIQGWDNFVEDYGYTCQKTEYRHYHPIYRYGLTIDQAGIITKGKYQGASLGDIKSGCPSPAHKYQLAAYKMAIGKHYTTFILYLNPKFLRGYKIVFSKNSKREQSVFLAALTIYNVRKTENLL